VEGGCPCPCEARARHPGEPEVWNLGIPRPARPSGSTAAAPRPCLKTCQDMALGDSLPNGSPPLGAAGT